ncbi:MAG: hypothetical protein CMJ84_07810 [Planctomycetes bacterium]|jgi:hypothetical protein|nr:hypothetical protein [Planctomycetota bacterium]MDP6410274.1 DUF1080 domain-containing protein [Planctomycetota bacterium]
MSPRTSLSALALLLGLCAASPQEEIAATALPRAFIDGSGPGWRALTLADFVNVNGEADTWSEKDGSILCSGVPLGGARSREVLENFELVCEWRHHVEAGNSGIFLWCPEEAFTDLPPGQLPRSGIEVQVLDLAYETRYEEQHGKQPDWFTSHGDVFPVGASSMKPFPPAAPNGRRSFPTQRRSRGVGEWNHYYVRAVNGEVRLWVNGQEVSGGNECKPARGYLALESEGSLIEFRNLRLRELP